MLREGALGTAVGPHQSLGMEGGPHQAQTGPRGRPSKAGRSGGGRGQRTGPRFVPSEGRGPLLLLPNTLHRANSRATGFPGRPHSAAPTFPGWWVRAPPPPATPTGNARGAHCLGRLRRLSHSPGVPLQGRSKPRTRAPARSLNLRCLRRLRRAASARSQEGTRRPFPSPGCARVRHSACVRASAFRLGNGSRAPRAPAGAKRHGRGLPRPRDPVCQPRTHHSEAEVLRAGRGRAPGPAGSQREQQQRQGREPGPGGRRAGPGDSAAPHPARGAVGTAVQVPALLSPATPGSPRPCVRLPAPLRPAPLLCAPAPRASAPRSAARRSRPARARCTASQRRGGAC